MTNFSYATVAQGFTVGQRMFCRPANAEITKDLLSAFVPVVVETPLEDGQRYMGGIVFSLCETKWFCDCLAKYGLLEDAAEEVLTAFRELVNGDDSGAWASTVIEDIRKIVVGYAQRMGWIIDLSMSYSIVKSYIEGYQMEMNDPERDIEDAQIEVKHVKGTPKDVKVKKGSGHDYFSVVVEDEPKVVVDNKTLEQRAVACVKELNESRPDEGGYLDFAYYVLETLDRYGFVREA